MKVKERIEGVVFGTAVGDSLGYVCEFDKSTQPIEGLNPGMLWSDDTQMFLATCEGLLDAGEAFYRIDIAGEAIAKRYVAWAKSPENNRAPGGACMEGCRNLAVGANWHMSGKINAKGCGTAMRSMAYPLFLTQVAAAAEMAAEHALMTHRDPTARAAAAAVAAGVWACMSGFSKRDVASVMVDAAHVYDPPTGKMLLEAVEHSKESAPSLAAILDKWRGWRGDEAVAASLYCFLQGGGYADSVLMSVNSPGDSDSLGAITGALCGAFYGVNSIPEHWRKSVEDSALLQRMADRIDRSSELAPTPDVRVNEENAVR